MENNKETITLQGIVDGKIADLMPKTTTDNVLLEDGSNLTDKLAELDSGGSGSSSWDSVTDKPFETLGDGLSVDEKGVLSTVGSIAERNVTIDVLWDEIIDSAGTYTLTKSIDDYDFLIASAWGWTSSNTYEQSNYIIIPKKDYYIRSTEGTGWAFCICTSNSGSDRRCIFQFDDDVTLNVAYQSISKFRALYGVKLGSGGLQSANE